MDYALTQWIKEIERKLKSQSQIALAWKKFVSKEHYQIEIEEQIQRDWERVSNLGVNHQTIPRKSIGEEELGIRLKRMQPVLNLAIPLMKGMFDALSSSHTLHNIKFYDQDGVLLHVVADEQTLKLINQLGLGIGSLMNENCWGNNGTGTCLFKKRPICIVGQEHYLEVFKPWVCFDYPVVNTDGSILGGIDIAVAIETANPLTMALLHSGVKNLEEQIREKQFRQSLNQSIEAKERFYKQIMNRVRQCVIIFNREGQLITANQPALEQFPMIANWEEEQITIKDIPFISDYLEEKNIIENVKVEIEDKVCLVNMFDLGNDLGADSYRILVANDVTQLEKYEKQSHHKDKLALVGTIASGLAHELRNPLTAIKGFIQLALSRDCIDQKTRRHLHISLQEIDRTNKLISDFLLLGKPSSEKKKKIAIREIVESSLELCKHCALENDVEILTSLGQEEYQVYGDRDKLIQVLINIISNGIDAMKDSRIKLLKINIVSMDDFIKIVIEDSGKGIKQEILPKLGTPFFTTKENGTGLGLSIANNIISAHNGTLEIKSSDRGSNIDILLPRC